MHNSQLLGHSENIALTGHNASEPSDASTIVTQVHTICAQLDGVDSEIAQLEQQLAELPQILGALAGHPVLWLLLGREGIDRPGSLGAVVGQQVVTVTRQNYRVLIGIALVMLLVGMVCGVGLHQWLIGGLA